jgi:antitoxin HicB
LPELISEGDAVEEALANVREAFQVVLEIYEDQGRPLPDAIVPVSADQPIETKQLLATV